LKAKVLALEGRPVQYSTASTQYVTISTVSHAYQGLEARLVEES
jgi:hypothetical protein